MTTDREALGSPRVAGGASCRDEHRAELVEAFWTLVLAIVVIGRIFFSSLSWRAKLLQPVSGEVVGREPNCWTLMSNDRKLVK